MLGAFKNFECKRGTVKLHGRRGGQGAPLLLLHGHPQTHVMWHAMAPGLAQHFSVLMMDLRGYGGPGRPPADRGHQACAKREMALDALAVMPHHGCDGQTPRRSAGLYAASAARIGGLRADSRQHRKYLRRPSCVRYHRLVPRPC